MTVTSLFLYFREIHREHALFGPSQSLKVTSQKVAPVNAIKAFDLCVFRFYNVLLRLWCFRHSFVSLFHVLRPFSTRAH